MGCCTGPGAEPTHVVRTLRTRVNGADESTILLELANTVRDFCLETTIWRADITIPLVAGKVRYKITSPEANAEVAYVLAVKRNASWVPARAGNFPLNPDAYWYMDFRELGYLTTSAGFVSEDPSPLSVHVFLLPCDGQVEIPTTLAHRFHDCLVEGTLSRLYNYSKRPFSSPVLAAKSDMLYRAGLNEARAIARQGSAMYGRTWVAPYYAGGTGAGRHGTFAKGGL